MQNGENLRKKLAWVFIFILVAAASVWAGANQSDDFTVTYDVGGALYDRIYLFRGLCPVISRAQLWL